MSKYPDMSKFSKRAVMIDRRVKIDKQLSVIEFGEQSIIVELSIKRITVNCQFTVTIVNY